MKQWLLSFPLLFLITYGLTATLTAKETADFEEKKGEKKKLYIGIETHRIPYSYVNDQQKKQGILVEATTQLCERINAHCTFVTDNFPSLLQQLANHQLHAVINIDTVILPKIDKLKLSIPLCRINPVFIQQKSSDKKTFSDFKNTTIGVLEGSLLHFYLLDYYSSLTRIKAYSVLESAVFDLTSGRIDALYADEAFFQQRVATTSLAHKITPPIFIDEQREQPTLAPITMALVLRENDNELFTLFEKALSVKKQPPDCTRLLKQEKQPAQQKLNTETEN
jgi:ABC-type amino acid transport substrate-binding protein